MVRFPAWFMIKSYFFLSKTQHKNVYIYIYKKTKNIDKDKTLVYSSGITPSK